jgi:hypothetical protein
MGSILDNEAPTLPLMEMPPAVAPERDDDGMPVFTGEAFYRNRPREYAIAVAMAAEGNTIRSIARVIGASKNTIQAILARERVGMTMEKYREQSSLRLRNSLAQAMDRIDEALQDDERMKKASLRDMAYTLKELAEKMQLFSGGVTHRAGRQDETEHAGDLDYLRRMQTVEAEITETDVVKPADVDQA